MKHMAERRFIDFHIDGNDLVRYLIERGVLKPVLPSPVTEAFSSPSFVQFIDMPEDVRIVAFSAQGMEGHPRLRITLESDSLPDWFKYRGNHRYQNADFPREKP